LHGAAGISRSDDFGFCFHDAAEFSPSQAICHIWLSQVVAACSPAAEFWFIDGFQLDPGDQFQQIARLLANFLGML
jgi:hypothetical protein